jgi:hypothetical protein
MNVIKQQWPAHFLLALVTITSSWSPGDMVSMQDLNAYFNYATSHA